MVSGFAGTALASAGDIGLANSVATADGFRGSVSQAQGAAASPMIAMIITNLRIRPLLFY
ncbi:hypothetical protein A8M32_26025 [Sinorhizobium alkalisoli]|uniref:Uncharacterized protein n=1 Tax=Sinorhizobium alkalisoli TaxID=1752398 RepID=A0A1E3V4K2_9HYPH|nr:hypothetical protein A8M32_26025 [Sinorhizobium alkalisoli]QFI69521.1 hypothetical protein EKH55_4647 [Sinorhizobium alkalisoli]